MGLFKFITAIIFCFVFGIGYSDESETDNSEMSSSSSSSSDEAGPSIEETIFQAICDPGISAGRDR